MTSITRTITLILAILIGVSIHESAHALAAYWLGDDSAKQEGRISLNPIKHISMMTVIFGIFAVIMPGAMIIPFKPVMISRERLSDPRWGMAITSMAGPLSNVLLGFFAAGIGRLVVIYYSGFSTLDAFGQQLIIGIQFFSQIQFFLFIFNMLPIPPLDGHWVLGALVPAIDRLFDSFRYGMTGFIILMLLLYPIRHIMNLFYMPLMTMINSIMGIGVQ